MTALSGRVAGCPALTAAQTKKLAGWLAAAEASMKKKAAKERLLCRPLAVVGASWVLLGEAKRGEEMLASAIAVIDPEDNSTEHRRVVAQALAAVGRVGDAITHLCSSKESPSWTETPAAFAAIAPRASAAELKRLFTGMKKVDGHNERVLLDRGLARLIALKAWDAALKWIPGFERFSERESIHTLATAMAAAGEVERAVAALQPLLKPEREGCGESLKILARIDPAQARPHLKRLVAAAPKIAEGKKAQSVLRGLAGAATVLGALEVAAKVEAIGRDASERFAAREGVLAELAPGDPAWAAWFARARAEFPKDEGGVVRLAVLAHRGGQSEVQGELIARIIEEARAAGSADLTLEEHAGRLARAGDLAGAHRVWQAIAKGRRADRNRPLLDACVAREQWAAVLDLLRQMPMDLNGAPQKASKVLLTAAGGEGW